MSPPLYPHEASTRPTRAGLLTLAVGCLIAAGVMAWILAGEVIS